MKFHEKPNTFVSQVHLKVKDFDLSLAFYQKVIGFKVLEQAGKKAVLTADGRTPLVTIDQPDHVVGKEPRRAGLYHYALLLPTRADLGKVIRHLIETRYPLQGASDHLVSEALYLADPDGNGIEIYADRPASTWKWNGDEVVMTTEAMDAESVLAEAKGERWEGLPEGTVMGHIHLHVSEFEKTEEFYCKGLGFEIVCRYGGQALFISTGGYHHHIGLNTWNGVGAPAPSENSAGLRFFTVVFPGADAREKAVERLKSLGAAVTEKNGVYMAKDPSGTAIELSI
ncbi:VOC family protein [Mesobacillus foraminis]|uniref:VOC family protein n=1 Tax=Mesobacillus foraminis TaxID=279826 RepID=UPI000EF555A1|nr:VOC family protein [Mesobacillus foraminis]